MINLNDYIYIYIIKQYYYKVKFINICNNNNYNILFKMKILQQIVLCLIIMSCCSNISTFKISRRTMTEAQYKAKMTVALQRMEAMGSSAKLEMSGSPDSLQEGINRINNTLKITLQMKITMNNMISFAKQRKDSKSIKNAQQTLENIMISEKRLIKQKKFMEKSRKDVKLSDQEVVNLSKLYNFSEENDQTHANIKKHIRKEASKRNLHKNKKTKNFLQTPTEFYRFLQKVERKRKKKNKSKNRIRKKSKVSSETSEEINTAILAECPKNEAFVNNFVSGCPKSFMSLAPQPFCVKEFGLPDSPNCPDKQNWEKFLIWCQEKCPANHYKRLGICWENCPSGYSDWGIICYGGWFRFKTKKINIPTSISFFSSSLKCSEPDYYKSLGFCFRDCKSIGLQNCLLGFCTSGKAECGLNIAKKLLSIVTGVFKLTSMFLTFGASAVATTVIEAAISGIKSAVSVGSGVSSSINTRPAFVTKLKYYGLPRVQKEVISHFESSTELIKVINNKSKIIIT